jgi:hypothetical protein
VDLGLGGAARGDGERHLEFAFSGLAKFKNIARDENMDS